MSATAEKNADIVSALRRRDIPRPGNFLEAFAAVVTEALAAGDEIPLHLFGTFSVRQYARRRVLNPRTGAPCYVPARRKARFRPSAALREALNGRTRGGGFGR